MRAIRTIIFLLVCLGLLWLVVILFSKVFSGGNQTKPIVTAELSGYARPGTAAQYSFDGPVVMNQDHRTLRITVDASQTAIELISGYDGSVVRRETFPNTVESYTVFLRSLETQGFTKRSKSTITQDERGQCPLQYRYVYKLTENGQDIMRAWSTSCGTGTFGGSGSAVRTLFQRQIPPKVYGQFNAQM